MQNNNNAFFKFADPHAYAIQGHEIHATFWSRHYEYPWAFQFAGPGQVVADMGCGWHQRPFKDALTMVCENVYAVDAHPEVVKLESHANMEFVVADITQRIDAIPESSLDRVFCISVLEDVGELVGAALQEFARCVKTDGLIVLTFDSQYDYAKPLGRYPGVNLDNFIPLVEQAGLAFVGNLDQDKAGALFHQDFNLAVWHCVLQRA